MLDVLVENFRGLVMTTMLVSIVIARIHRVIGSGLGLVSILIICVVGSVIYQRGGSVGLGTMPVSQPIFYVFCVILALLNLMALRTSLLRTHSLGRS